MNRRESFWTRYRVYLRVEARKMLTRSNARAVIELAGFGLIVAAAFEINFALGLLVGGIVLVIVGNLA